MEPLNCTFTHAPASCATVESCCESQCNATGVESYSCGYPYPCVCLQPDADDPSDVSTLASALSGVVLFLCCVACCMTRYRQQLAAQSAKSTSAAPAVEEWGATSKADAPSPKPALVPKPASVPTAVTNPVISVYTPGLGAGLGASPTPSTPTETWTARHVVQYDQLRFVRQLGQGSFGTVALADWRGTQVAVKVLHSADAEGEESFMQEAQLMDQVCNHPNVLRLLGVCLQPKRVLIFPFYDLGSMEDLLVKPGARNQRGTLPWHVVVRMLIQAAAGIHHLHQEGTIHRDLALRNLLVNAHYEVAVADFGMSRVKDSARASGFTSTRIGPIKWEAPEVLSFDSGKPYSEATDVFSFGMCMWEAVVGTEPWPGLSHVAAGMKTLTGERNPMPSGFRDTLVQSLIREAWAQSPTDRPTMGNLLARLRAHFDSGLVPRGTIAEVTGVGAPAPRDTGAYTPWSAAGSMGGASAGGSMGGASAGGSTKGASAGRR